MTHAGMINIGELARKKYGSDEVYLVGFGGYKGTVIAGDAWGAPMEEMDVPPAKKDSIEDVLHRLGTNDRYMLFDEETAEMYDKDIDHRAIGVVYHPGREKYGNYVPTVMSQRYDAFIYLDSTKALHPLHLPTTGNKMPETYPFGV